MFSSDMKVTVKREDYLSNKNNKMALIAKLASMLDNDGHVVTLSQSDADTDIDKVAIEVQKISHLGFIFLIKMYFRRQNSTTRRS